MSKDKDSLLDWMQGAVPETDIKWGNIAVGAAIGIALGNEINNLGQSLLTNDTDDPYGW